MKFTLLAVWMAWEEATCLFHTWLWLWKCESLKLVSFERQLAMSQHALFSACQDAETPGFLYISVRYLQWSLQNIGFGSLYLLIFYSGIFIPRRERIWRNDTALYSTGSKNTHWHSSYMVAGIWTLGLTPVSQGLFLILRISLKFLVTLWYLWSVFPFLCRSKLLWIHKVIHCKIHNMRSLKLE